MVAGVEADLKTFLVFIFLEHGTLIALESFVTFDLFVATEFIIDIRSSSA